MSGPHLFICFAENDKAIAAGLLQMLAEKHLFVLDKFHISEKPVASEVLSEAFLIVIVSSNAKHDKKVLADIEVALQNGMKIIPVKAEACKPPTGLEKFLSFDLEHLFSSQLDGFAKVLGVSPGSFGSYSLAPASKSKNVFKSIIETVNPFKKSKNKKADIDFTDESYFGSSPAGTASGKSYRSARPVVDDSDFGEGFSGSGNPALHSLDKMLESMPPPQPSPAPAAPGNTNVFIAERTANENLPKGKLLYDIPDSMTVNVQHKCIVRVGANEATVLDDDTFTPAVKIEPISLSEVMEADLVDLSDPPRFSIRKISSAEQIVENDSYTEWLFMVTPLTSGKHPLILKVSFIRQVNGKERRKELVFEKEVNIAAGTTETPTATIQPVVTKPAQSETTLKDLAGEQQVKEFDPPKVFISYAHADKVYFDGVLRYLKAHSNWNIWTDRDIAIGSPWFNEIQDAIKRSDMGVLLVSAFFISSVFIEEHEVKSLKQLKQSNPGFIFLPILLEDVDFSRWKDLSDMQLFVAYGDEYGVPEKRGEMISFGQLYRFDKNGLPIPNDNVNTFFKIFVKKAEKEWLALKLKP